MKQIIPALLILFLLTTCKKIDYYEQRPIDSEDKIICIVPQEAEFPGGIEAWREYLQQNLVYPETAVEKEIQGTVVVQFVVCEDGEVCNIEAISGPEELKQSAIEVFKKSPKWVPAKMRDEQVSSYKKQPIVFRLEVEEE